MLLTTSRFFQVIEEIPLESRTSSSQVEELASEGCRLYQRLLQAQIDHTARPHANPHEKLAIANNYANVLFVCKNFTFYDCWGVSEIPMLTTTEAEKLATNIVDISDKLLEASSIPGILLLFPLRMAGVVASRSLQRERIVAVLNRVHDQGFAIARWIRHDVEALWQWQGSMAENQVVY